MAPNFVRPTVREMEGYTPGEQPKAGQRVIKLNTNENPFPPSPKVMDAIRAIDPDALRKYPESSTIVFREAAAKVFGFSPDWIITGNGSDDVLAFAMQTFLSPGDVLAYAEPTYSLYPVIAQLDAVKVATVPWEKDWGLPIDALLATKAKAVFICNPNAPSATFVSPARIDEFAKKFNGAVLIDEAYVEFAEDHCLPLVRKYNNVVVTRTLSKSYSLCGLRFGFGIAQPDVIREMNKARDSYPCDAISIVAATAAILDQDHAHKSWEFVKAERSRVTKELSAMGWAVIPSSANFVFATVPGGRAKEIYLGLKHQGILVRYFDKPDLSDKLRITIGTAEENTTLVEAIRKLSTDKGQQ